MSTIRNIFFFSLSHQKLYHNIETQKTFDSSEVLCHDTMKEQQAFFKCDTLSSFLYASIATVYTEI